MKIKLLSTLFFLLAALTSFAQNSLYFQGENIEMIENIDVFKTSDVPSNKIVNQGFYGWVQFNQTPNQETQAAFKAKDFLLLNYLGNKTYLFHFPYNADVQYLKSVGVRSILPMNSRLKTSSNIKHDIIGDWAVEGNNVILNIQHFKNLQTNLVVSEITKINGLVVKNQYKNNHNLTISIPRTKINELVEVPFIKWVEVVQEPSVKEDIRGRSIHRSSNLDTQTPGGRNYTGLGIGVLVRDDGIVGEHIDFQGRIDNSAASGGTTSADSHGDGVAGIMAGAGNLNPANRGMAAESDVYVVNYASSFLDAATTNLINTGSVIITNSSYGNGCNAGYTTVTSTVDTQANNNLSLLHVFSAGNSGTQNCNYGVPGWGNITGGHKQGKNVIATANVFFNGGHVSSSSHGPAYDGRIKPDITAHGQGQISTEINNTYQSFGGTSGAAPGIAGVSAQLYQLYKDANSGDLPESALIKATLLNTAQDYGRVGPDFEYGWGLVNGLRAAQLLEDQRYLDAEATQGNTNTHTINVPAGTTQVRFMVYWNDPAANAGATSALINDLDLVVKNPSNTSFLPWVLDPSATTAALTTPATTGVDRLNNMEQVLINNPDAGDYTLEINGFNVPQGPQKYYVVYEIIEEELVITYPQGGEKLVTGEQTTIHWDATNTTNGFNIQYSSDNGGTWTNVASTSTTAKNYTWTIPSGLTPGEYLMRVTSGSFTSTSQPFSIAGQVSGINVTQVCPNTVSVGWNAVTGASSYKVYLLGDKFMEEVGTSSTNSFAIPITDPSPTGGFWIAVSAVGSDWETRRSVAINRAPGLFNCSLSTDIGVVSVQDNFSNFICSGSNSAQVVATISNTGTDSQTGFTLSYQLDGGTPVEETFTGTIANGAQTDFTFSSPVQITTDGNHTIQVNVVLTGDQNNTNDNETLSFYTQVNGAPLNTVEDLETSFPPGGWEVINPDNDAYTWAEATVVGSDGNTTKAAFMDHADYSTRNREDHLVTQVYDLTNANGVSLKFDLAKAQWSATFNDRLKVDVSADCGVTYTNVYDKDGLDLSTIANYQGSEWVPATAADWRNESVDLSAYLGQKIQIRFTSVNDFSNSTFIDNIEVSGALSVATESLNDYISVYPNPVNDILKIRTSNIQQLESYTIYNVLGKEILSRKINNNQPNFEINVEELATGLYFLKLQGDGKTGVKRLIKK